MKGIRNKWCKFRGCNRKAEYVITFDNGDKLPICYKCLTKQ